jgi:hypothetical protein
MYLFLLACLSLLWCYYLELPSPLALVASDNLKLMKDIDCWVNLVLFVLHNWGPYTN